MTKKSSAKATLSKPRILLVILFLQRLIAANIITAPKDSEALVGTLTFFNCSSDFPSSTVQWFHYAIGVQENRQIVYGYGQFYGSLCNRSRIERNDTIGELNLIIDPVSGDDAGKFECQDNMGRGSSSFADLSVLEAKPDCQWKIENREETGSDGEQSTKRFVNLNCTVDFRGNIPPRMIWKRSGSNENFSERIVQISVSSSRVSYILQESHRFEGQSFQCETTRSATTQISCSSVPSSATNVIMIVLIVVGIFVLIVVIVVVGICIKKRMAAGRAGQPAQQQQEEKKASHNKEPERRRAQLHTPHKEMQKDQNQDGTRSVKDTKKIFENKQTAPSWPGTDYGKQKEKKTLGLNQDSQYQPEASGDMQHITEMSQQREDAVENDKQQEDSSTENTSLLNTPKRENQSTVLNQDSQIQHEATVDMQHVTEMKQQHEDTVEHDEEQEDSSTENTGLLNTLKAENQTTDRPQSGATPGMKPTVPPKPSEAEIERKRESKKQENLRLSKLTMSLLQESVPERQEILEEHSSSESQSLIPEDIAPRAENQSATDENEQAELTNTDAENESVTLENVRQLENQLTAD